MGEVLGKRRSGGDGEATAGDLGGVAPGKTTRTAALQRKAAPGAPAGEAADVSEVARGELGASFGGRAHGVAYAVGGGAAEARGANAVTVGGQVDFAPGQFELDSGAGRARLGEETAHAVQQANPGAPASVEALEGEAKQAGQDFAAGVTPQVALAAPPGLALAEDPKDKAPKDTDPSTEVPDLQHGEVTAIKKVLATDPDQALALLLAALQRKDATAFSSKDLTDKKLHTRGGASSTVQGPAFEAWLEKCIDNYAKKLSKARGDLSPDEVKAAIHADPVPAAKQDITVAMGSAHFASVSLLYSSVRHEFVHVQQMRADYLAHIPSSVMPTGVSAPDSGTTLHDREVEAYLWEMENVAQSGLKEPGELHLLWDASSDAWLNIGAKAKAALKPRYTAAFIKVWQLAMDGHIAAIGGHHATFKKDGVVPNADTVVYTLQQHMNEMWSYGTSFGNDPSPTEPRYKAALAQSQEILGNGPDAEFKKALDEADAELKAGYSDAWSAYRTWFALLEKWINLDAALTKTYQARFKVTAPALWREAFRLYEAKVGQQLADGDVEGAASTLETKIATLFMHADKSHIKAADYQKRRTALEEAVKKAKTP